MVSRLVRGQPVVLTAGLLVMLSLGLPWTTSSLTYVPGWMTPSFCYPSFDGTMSCSFSYVAPGFFTGAPAQSGASSVARVFLVAALVLIIVSRVTAQSRWLAYAAAGLVLAVLLAGLTMQAGQLAALAAAALLARAAFTGRGWTARRTHSPPGRPVPST
ncbi:hypothetical protein [Ornithinimicrobium pratense]|uniref:Uncharacterized protein n=1 Tax=Ornithinimicrobium pratense TaxID=2593973 RepID=A0A5J6V1X9_9MICO|nr:hypothetical protein [Ornithinimicrobium pratense]QFG67665.1 hypothetical protein FY030_02010 [Ornithinimicrobium pratense]